MKKAQDFSFFVIAFVLFSQGFPTLSSMQARNTLNTFLAQAAQHKAGATRPVAVAAPSAAAQQGRAAMIRATRAGLCPCHEIAESIVIL